MKTKKLGTLSFLGNVAQNLYHHSETAVYWGVKQVGGKKLIHSLETKDRITANGRLRDWLGELEKTDPGNTDLNLAMLGERFLAARAAKSAATRGHEKTMWEAFRRTFPRPMETLVARVLPSDVETWLAKIKTTRTKRSSSFNRWRLFVRQLFERAELDAKIPSPFVERKIPVAKKERVERPIPSEAEFVRIIAEIRKPSWKHVKGTRGGQRPMHQPESADFAEFLGRAGVGQAEAAALRWEDVGEREIRFTRQKTGKEFAVIITPDLRPLLVRRREAAGGAKASGPVFKVANVKKALTNALLRLGMRHFSQRNLRSFKIVKMLDAGLDPKFIATQQGHSDGGVLIMSTYSEVIRRNQHAYEDEQMKRFAAAGSGGKVVPFRAAVA
jgi:integrase